MKYKICWITLCKNEERIIPYCIDYWKALGVAKVIVWDNESDDSSVELLSQEDFIEVRTFKTSGQTETVQKKLKEDTYLEIKDKYDVCIVTDMDEIFYFNDFEAVLDTFINGRYNVLVTPIFSLCEAKEPPYVKGVLLHKLCTNFYKQRMNHTPYFEAYSKFSIFNCHTTDGILMSVGQHYVRSYPTMNIMYSNDGFNLHINKGLSLDFMWKSRQRMFNNLSEENKKCGFCVEYGDSYEKLKQDYENNIKNSFNINSIFSF